MPDPKSEPMTPLVEWFAVLIASIPGIIALAMSASQPETGTLFALGLAWIAGVGGAKFFASMAMPWSKPPFLAVAPLFGSTFANFLSAYWGRYAPKQSGTSPRFHLIFGFAAGLAFTALFCAIFPVGTRIAGLIVGATGGIAFALLRFVMLR